MKSGITRFIKVNVRVKDHGRALDFFQNVGNKIAFIHPRDAFGLLIELIERPPAK